MADRWGDEDCERFFEYACDDGAPSLLRKVLRGERTYERKRIMATAARVLTEKQIAALKAALKESK